MENASESASRPQRPAKAPAHRLLAFGALLRHLRGEKSVQQLVTAMLSHRPRIVTMQPTISGWEQGNIWSPDPCVLWGLADALKTSHEGLLAVICANRQNAHLTLREARRIMEAHYAGPSPSVAAEALRSASGQLVIIASHFEDLAHFGASEATARARRKT